LNTAGQLLLGVPKMEGNQVGSPGAIWRHGEPGGFTIQTWWVRSHYSNSNGKSDEMSKKSPLTPEDFDDFAGFSCHFQRNTYGFGRWISSRASLLPLVYGLQIWKRMSG